MNVYLIKDGGDDRCWKAETMAEAVKASEDAYMRENQPFNNGNTDEEERQHYRDGMLESCQLIAELGNP